MSDPTVHPRADADETQALPRTPPSWGPTATAASPAEETAGLRSEGLSPSGRTWFVTRIPCPRVVLNTDHVTVDGQRVALAEKQTPRDAATQRLQEIAVALRGIDGAVRAAISVGDNGAVRNTIVTARGEVFDDNEQFASGGSTISRPPTRDRPSRKVLVATAAAAVSALVVTAIAISAATGDSSDPSPVLPPLTRQLRRSTRFRRPWGTPSGPPGLRPSTGSLCRWWRRADRSSPSAPELSWRWTRRRVHHCGRARCQRRPRAPRAPVGGICP
ncbi:MAG: hypothetical protein ACXVGI_07185 [Mycobacteriaceae bacterium]